MKKPRDHSRDAAYLVRTWGVVGGPNWGTEPAEGDAHACRLAKAGRADQLPTRLAVYAVPLEYAGLTLDSLIRAAGDGQLECLFLDKAQSAAADGSRS